MRDVGQAVGPAIEIELRLSHPRARLPSHNAPPTASRRRDAPPRFTRGGASFYAARSCPSWFSGPLSACHAARSMFSHAAAPCLLVAFLGGAQP